MNVQIWIIKKIFMNKRILVLGKNGQLGKSLYKVIKDTKDFLNKEHLHLENNEDLLLSEKSFFFYIS